MVTDEDRRKAEQDRRMLLTSTRVGSRGQRATDPSEDPAAVLARAGLEIDVAERLLDLAVAAKRLRRCPATIRTYIRTGRLRAVRPPAAPGSSRAGNFLIPESAIRDFLTQAVQINDNPTG